MDSDPVIASYDIYLTDSDISRYVLQYLDRPTNQAYSDRHGQKPTSFRFKPQTGLVEVDVPISTRVNYDVGKGLRYGDAMRKSRSAREGGAYGMAGGFSSGGGGGGNGKVKMEAGGERGDVEMGAMDDKETASLLRVQTLGGRVKAPEGGDPVYMLAAFRGSMCFPFRQFTDFGDVLIGCGFKRGSTFIARFGRGPSTPPITPSRCLG